jgi:hypothetical protein
MDVTGIFAVTYDDNNFPLTKDPQLTKYVNIHNSKGERIAQYDLINSKKERFAVIGIGFN